MTQAIATDTAAPTSVPSGPRFEAQPNESIAARRPALAAEAL